MKITLGIDDAGRGPVIGPMILAGCLVSEDAEKELKSLGFESNLEGMASPWVGMNVFSIDPDTVMVDGRQTNLIRTLEKHRFNCIPIRLRHIYTQGGGLHCATIDTVRDSKLESYFD